MRWIALLAIVLMLCASLTACGSTTSTPPRPATSKSTPTSGPKAALAAIFSAAAAQKSVHWARTEGQDMVGTWTSTADVSAEAGSGPRLPISFSYREQSDSIVDRFSRWNEPLHVEAPAHSTPIAIVRG